MKQLVSEIHIFIIWEDIRKKIDELYVEIQRKFKIHDVYEITWPPENFSKNLKWFYRVTLFDPEKRQMNVVKDIKCLKYV